MTMTMLNNLSPEEASRAANSGRRTNFYMFLLEAFPIIALGRELVRDNYVETLCFELQEAAFADAGRLIITMPPRYLKSIAASIALTAWILGRNGATKILVASYAEALAVEHAAAFRRLVGSSFYRHVFPNAASTPTSDSATRYETSEGGGRRAVTVGGSVTGIGGDLVIVDDIMKASDASSDANRETARKFFDETLVSRLNDKATGSIIVVQQRLHQDDLIAHLLEKGTFRHVNFAAIAEKPETHRLYNTFEWRRDIGDLLAPGREDHQTLEQIKRDIGNAAFRTQYQQDPASAGSSMLDFSKVTVLEGDGCDLRPLQLVQTWDTAIVDSPNADYSVGMTFGWDDTRWILMDVIRRRMNFSELKGAARSFQKKWSPDLVSVEKSGNGVALVDDMLKEGRLEFKTLSVKNSKEERFSIAVEWLETGQLVLLRDAPYFDVLRRELLAFPTGRHDDQVDAISLFVRRMRLPRPVKPPRSRRRDR